MSTLRRFATLVLCIALLSVPARAGISQGKGEIGFDVGATDYDPNVSISDSHGWLFHVRGGWHFTERLQLEGQFGISVLEKGALNQELSVFFVNGLLNLRPEADVRPYLLVGLGRATLDLTGGFNDEARAFQVAVGGRLFTDKWKTSALRVEFSRLREKTFNETSTHHSVAVGLTWRVGPG